MDPDTKEPLYCGGPGVDPKCRVPSRSILGRTDYPICPRAMRMSPAWREACDKFRLSQVQPISGYPACLTVAGARSFIALRGAMIDREREEIRQAQQSAQSSSAGGGPRPRWDGRESSGRS